MSRFPPSQDRDPSEPFRWSDACVAARTSDDKWAVTSPNMDFIPTPPIGLVHVHMRTDYRYGIEDPIQWPQTFAEGYEYLAAVLRADVADATLSPIWWSPQEHDFETIEGSVIKCLGLLRRAAIQPLSDLVDALSTAIHSSSDQPDQRLSNIDSAMRHARERLICFPCTWRDVCLQVRLTQRFWLMARAFLDFYAVYPPKGPDRPVNKRFMGTFTTEPEAVQQLFAAGIPVWWLRLDLSILSDTKIGALVLLIEADRVCVELAPGYHDALYRGLSGPKHLQAVSRSSHTYQDLSRSVLLAVQSDRGYGGPPSQKEFKSGSMAPAGAATSRSQKRQPLQERIRSHPYNKPHGTQVRGVNKFEALQHEWMPPDLDVWRQAMTTVDLSKPARSQSEVWGYWIPDPGLFVRPQSADRRQRYISNWLRIRSAWLYFLRLREARATQVPTQWWRDFLYGDTGRSERDHETRNGRRIDEMQQVFSLAFEQADYDPTNTAPVAWFDFRLTSLEEKLCPKIMWEICELGFRHELLALDRLLVPGRDVACDEEQREELLGRIFADHSIFCVVELPTQPTGLAGPTPFHRATFLDAFRQVMSRWPRAPPSFYADGAITTNLSAQEIAGREGELITFYVNTFFEQSGRAPIVPRAIPM